ncbi:MAG TPA: lipid II flippase MurJ [Melioribacteraceae bacterium]|nr:lipid II flippase MurJ [Melioribacteraceae bacterium]
MSKQIINILKISVFLTLLNVFAKGIGFLREMVLAYYYGLNVEYDIFLVATTLLTILNSTIYYLSQNYFIPLYNRIIVANSNKNDGREFLSFSLFIFFSSSLLILFFLLLFKEPILGLFININDFNKIVLAKNIYTVYVFIVPINAIFSIFAAYYQAEFKFVRVVISQIILNLIIVFAVTLFSNKFGIIVIAYATLFATFIQFILLFYPIKKDIIFDNFLLRMFKEKSSYISAIIFITLLIEIISLSNSFIDRLFYQKLSSGSVSALNYAFNVVTLPLNIFAYSVLTVMFSKFSFNIGNNLLKENEYYLFKNLKFVFMSTILIAFLFFFHGVVLIKILFERGNFSYSNTILTGEILKYYAIGFPFIMGFSIINKLMYSYKMVKSLLIITTIASIIKIIISYLAIDYYGVNTLSASTSASYIAIFSIGYLLIIKKLKLPNWMQVVNYICKYFILGCFSILISLHLSGIIFPGKSFFYHITSSIIFSSIYLIVLVIFDKEVRYYFIKFIRKMI